MHNSLRAVLHWWLGCIVVPLGLLGLALPSTAHAQIPQDRSFSPQLFHPAPGNDQFITVESAAPLHHKQWGVGLFVDYARDPLAILTYDNAKGGTPTNSAQSSTRADTIKNAFSAEAWAAVGLIDRLQLALSIPMTLSQSGRTFTSTNPFPDGTTVAPGTGYAFGDPRLYIKARLFGRERDAYPYGFQIALSHWLGVPLGRSSDFGGEKDYVGWSGEGRLLAGWDADRFHIGLFFGFHWRAHESHFLATTIGQEITYGGAASFVAIRRWLTIVLELYGFHDFSTNLNAGPLEIDLAAKIGLYPGLSLNLGVGNGIIGGVGAPQPRVFLGAVYAPGHADRDHDGIPDAYDKCPDVPEDRDGFQDRDGCPDPDNDGDTILDRDDKCPNAKEDFDDFEDQDGCPDLDNDKDGVPDAIDPCPNDPEDGKPPKPNDGCPLSKLDTDGDGVSDALDKCPNDPEDKDGFEDNDGCPDPDNDNDGIPDEYDQCPNAPEDMDGFQDEDGCPDPDNDEDGVLDKNDKCLNVPETINGVKDDDGCPEPAPPPTVKVVKDQIVLTTKIDFATSGRLVPRSEAQLDQAAQLIRGHATWSIRIEGYTETQPDLDASVRESTAHAEAVRVYLAAHGIDAKRLSAAGYGSASPVADNKSAAGRNANRRVELHFVEAPKAKPEPAQ